MTFSRALARLGLVGALAVVLLTLSMAVSTVTSASSTPTVGMRSTLAGDNYAVSAISVTDRLTTALAGTDNSAMVKDPTRTFVGVGQSANVTSNLTSSGALPDLVVDVLGQGATFGPDTGVDTNSAIQTDQPTSDEVANGNAGLADDGGSKLWLALALVALGLAAAAAGSRVYMLRCR